MSATPDARLSRRYLGSSFAVATAAAALLVAVVGWSTRTQEQGLAADLGARVSEHLFREIEARWLPTHADGVAPRDAAEADFLEQLFALHRSSLRIPRIVWFDPSGTVVWAGSAAPPGTRSPHDNLLTEALRRGRAHELKEPGEPMHLDRARFDAPLLEVYVAAPAKIDPRLSGHVIELYLDATDLLARVAQSQRASIAGAAVVAGILFLAIRRLVRHAQARLAERNADLERLSSSLERQVDERTRALIRTRRLADVGTLAAGLAHEINNPLAIIGASAQGLLDRLRGDPAALDGQRADFDEYLRAIEGETFRCQRITQSLLDFARSTPPPAARVDLRALAQEVAGLLRPIAEKRRQEIVVRTDAQPVPVDAAPAELKQVLVNLLNNALDAGGPGHRIDVDVVRGERAQIVVRDRGRGLGELGPERIFEPFVTTKPPGEGLGMGLTISRHIAELHGGTLVAEIPEDRRGARFRLELPLAAAESPAPAQAAGAVAHAGGDA